MVAQRNRVCFGSDGTADRSLTSLQTDGRVMASLVKDPRRGTWAVQWHNGTRWTRIVVVRKRPGWKPGQPMPKRPPPEALAALADYTEKQRQAKRRPFGGIAERTIEEFLNRHVENWKVAKNAGSVLQLEQVVKIFLEFCKANKVVRLNDVTTGVCLEWMEVRARTESKRTKKPIAYSTLKTERALLATAWSAGIKRGTVTLNPWLSVEVPGLPDRRRRGSWSRAEYERLLAHCKPWLRDFIIVGCHTGFRHETLRGLIWSDVEWNRNREQEGFGFLIVRPENDKVHRGYVVPMHKRVHEVLSRRLIHRPPGVNAVLTGMRGRPITSCSTTNNAIVRACEKAGLKRPDSPNHHMRRTFGRWAVLGYLTGRPIPLYVVSRWMGHSSVEMTLRYLDVSEEDSTVWMLGGPGHVTNGPFRLNGGRDSKEKPRS